MSPVLIGAGLIVAGIIVLVIALCLIAREADKPKWSGQIVSGYRTPADQQRLAAEWLSHPGSSNHGDRYHYQPPSWYQPWPTWDWPPKQISTHEKEGQ